MIYHTNLAQMDHGTFSTLDRCVWGRGFSYIQFGWALKGKYFGEWIGWCYGVVYNLIHTDETSIVEYLLWLSVPIAQFSRPAVCYLYFKMSNISRTGEHLRYRFQGKNAYNLFVAHHSTCSSFLFAMNSESRVKECAKLNDQRRMA